MPRSLVLCAPCGLPKGSPVLRGQAEPPVCAPGLHTLPESFDSRGFGLRGRREAGPLPCRLLALNASSVGTGLSQASPGVGATETGLGLPKTSPTRSSGSASLPTCQKGLTGAGKVRAARHPRPHSRTLLVGCVLLRFSAVRFLKWDRAPVPRRRLHSPGACVL